MKRMSVFTALVVLVLGFSSGANAAVYKTDETTTTVAEEVKDDLFAASSKVHISAPVAGELFVVGSDIEINKRAQRSIFAAGESVTIGEGAGYNAFVAGRDILIKGTVDHDVYVAGATITIDPSAVVKGSLWIAGSDVQLNGRVDGNVNFSVANLKSSASIGGKLSGEANRVEFTGGNVGGDFSYQSNQEATGLDKVAISGKQQRTDIPADNKAQAAKQKSFVYMLLTTLVVGAAILLLVPHKVNDMNQMVTKNWGQMLLTGLIAFIVVPIASILLMVTVIGLPVGIIALVLWAVGMYIATVTGQMIVGKQAIDRLKLGNGNWWIALIAGVLLVQLLYLIPVVGGIVRTLFFLGVVLPTLGAAILWWKDRILQRAA